MDLYRDYRQNVTRAFVLFLPGLQRQQLPALVKPSPPCILSGKPTKPARRRLMQRESGVAVTASSGEPPALPASASCLVPHCFQGRATIPPLFWRSERFGRANEKLDSVFH